MIRTSRGLKQALEKLEDDFVICTYVDENGKEVEFVIDSVGHHKIHGDKDNMVCNCLYLRDGGQGCIKK